MNRLNVAWTSPLASILYGCGILGVSPALLHVHGAHEQGITLGAPGFSIPSLARNKRGMFGPHCEVAAMYLMRRMCEMGSVGRRCGSRA